MFSKTESVFSKVARDCGLYYEKGWGFFSKTTTEGVSFTVGRWSWIQWTRWVGESMADGTVPSTAVGHGRRRASRQSSLVQRFKASWSKRTTPGARGSSHEFTCALSSRREGCRCGSQRRRRELSRWDPKIILKLVARVFWRTQNRKENAGRIKNII